MTPAQFAADARLRTRTNSTTFADADILIFMAARQREIAKAILKADEDILLIPQTINLALNQRDYPVPSDILSRLKRVEAKLDGTNWLRLDEIDITQIRTPITLEADIVKYFSNNQDDCFYDLLRKSIYIYSGSIISVTAGLSLWCDTWPTAVSDLTLTTDMSVDPSTTTHGIPMELHDRWLQGVVIDWKQSREKPIALSNTEQNYEFYMQRDIETLKHGNLDREVIGELPPASERGHDGADY